MILNRRFDSYVLLKRLAIGGMAELFLAMKLGPGAFEKLVVIKCILAQHNSHPDFVKLFYDEAYIAGRFSHPNVIHTYDVDVFEGTHFLVMEHMSGTTIAELMDRAEATNDPLTQELAIKLVVDACEGLYYVHTLTDDDGHPLNIVHRDVSPQNIFVTFDGQAKVFDFGIAQMRKDPNKEDSNAGSLAGKYAYMSPEQCRGESIDARSDVFSLGIVLYELTTGRRLFARDNQIQTLRAIAEDPIPPPSTFIERYPRYLERIVMKALARDLPSRYEDALEMCEDLRKFLKISGSKPTSQLVSAYIKKLFAAEHLAFQKFVSGARADIEAKHGRRDPLSTSSSQRAALIAARSFNDPAAIAALAAAAPPKAPKPPEPAALPDIDIPLTPSISEAEFEHQKALLFLSERRVRTLRLLLIASVVLLVCAISLAILAALRARSAPKKTTPPASSEVVAPALSSDSSSPVSR